MMASARAQGRDGRALGLAAPAAQIGREGGCQLETESEVMPWDQAPPRVAGPPVAARADFRENTKA